MAAGRRTTTRAAVLPARRSLPEVFRFAPSGRSLLAGLLLLLLGCGGYLLARQSSVFAVRSLSVRGGTPALRADVRAALRPLVGHSLLRVDGSDVQQRLASIPAVKSFVYDRSFPHTLRVVVRAERPVFVLREGTHAYLVSSTGRVLRSMSHPRASSLPRLWLPAATHATVGEEGPIAVRIAAVALAPIRPGTLPRAVQSVVASRSALLLVLDGGFQVRLGDVGDLRLKLAVARKILGQTGAAAASGYVDVSVPERPVLFSNPQVEG